METNEQQQILAMINELAALELELTAQEARKKIRRSDELKKALLATVQKVPDDTDVVFRGDTAEVVFGPVPQVQVISNKPRLKRLIGTNRFIALAQFTVKMVQQVLNQQELDSVTEKIPGTRHLKEVRPIKTGAT